MKETWNGETRELGAGSYPEPPAVWEEERLCCEECGWERGERVPVAHKLRTDRAGRRDLEGLNGVLLCADCRERAKG